MTDLIEFEDFLAHYGVKGMKWGVRRDRSSGGSRRGGGKTSKKSADAPKAPKASKPRKESHSSVAKKMSDNELQAVLKRMDMEKRYSQLMKERDAGSDGRGKKLAAELAGKYATKVGELALQKAANYTMEKIVIGLTKAAAKAAVKKSF